MGMGGGRPPAKQASREGKGVSARTLVVQQEEWQLIPRGSQPPKLGWELREKDPVWWRRRGGLCRAGTFRSHQHSLGDCSFRS